jgi:Fic family protein
VISDICGVNWKEYPWGQENLQQTLHRVEQKKDRLATMRPIPSIALEKLRESLMLEWTYHSNAIEGNTITLNETRVILSDGITVGGKTLREHFETLNHHEALKTLSEMVSTRYKLSAADVLSLHGLVLQRIEKDFAGRYRNAGVRITGANFTPPNALRVDELMEDLINWVNEEKKISVIVKAMIFHYRMVWIHPFFDGNGRTVRLVFNLLLMNAGYPPAIILQQDRKKYYDALNKCNQGNYEKLMLMILQALERSLDIYLSHLENTHESYKPISQILKDIEVPYGQEYLSLLMRRGKIAGYKEGRNWLTTAEAVAEYTLIRKEL